MNVNPQVLDFQIRIKFFIEIVIFSNTKCFRSVFSNVENFRYIIFGLYYCKNTSISSSIYFLMWLFRYIPTYTDIFDSNNKYS